MVRRLEILIDAPIDESQRAEQAAQVAARKAQLAQSGGQLYRSPFPTTPAYKPSPPASQNSQHWLELPTRSNYKLPTTADSPNSRVNTIQINDHRFM